MKTVLNKIQLTLLRMRIQPIRVFCMHHVCEKFDANSMHESDWMSLIDFENRVSSLQNQGVHFISLDEAYRHIKYDSFRFRKYAVLTFDDGYASLMEVLPWLEEHGVPCVLFINGKYLDGISYRDNPEERYLSQNKLFQISNPLVEIGSHGWEHTDACKVKQEELEANIKKNTMVLCSHPRYIPFHAFPWGRFNDSALKLLNRERITPVLMDGMKNYTDSRFIHRELFKP